MFVVGAQCMCDRSYGEDDAEDDEAEDTGYGQHRTRDLLKFSSSSCAIENAPHSGAKITTRNPRIFAGFSTIAPGATTLHVSRAVLPCRELVSIRRDRSSFDFSRGRGVEPSLLVAYQREHARRPRKNAVPSCRSLLELAESRSRVDL